MIGESGNVSALVNSEKLSRDNLNGGTGRQAKDSGSSQTLSSADSVSLSPEAIAMARNAPPAGEASENGSGTESERRPETAESSRKGNIDIRV